MSFSAYTTMTHTRTLRSTEEDKNSNKHGVRLSKRERERDGPNERDSSEEIRADRQAEICGALQ